jgi:hypothetical protein
VEEQSTSYLSLSSNRQDDVNEIIDDTVPQEVGKLPLFSFLLMSSYAFFVMFQPYSSFLVPFYVETIGITQEQVITQIVFLIYKSGLFSSISNMDVLVFR